MSYTSGNTNLLFARKYGIGQNPFQQFLMRYFSVEQFGKRITYVILGALCRFWRTSSTVALGDKNS